MKTSKSDLALQIFYKWYSELPVHSTTGGPARGTLSGALIVLDRLQQEFKLDLDSHRTKGKSQLIGLSAAAERNILGRFGETRPFLKEGGRTNRGLPGDIDTMLKSIAEMHLDKLTKKERNEALQQLQEFLVNKVRDFHNRQTLRLEYDPSFSTWQFIHNLLNAAKGRGTLGQVAQYLVGAKLQLRYPDIKVDNYSYSTADDQLKRGGDFLINDTIFHVTAAPMPAVYEKCKSNVGNGFRVYLLVPDRFLTAAKDNAEMHLSGKIFVGSIEAFVGQNIEELSVFSRNRIISEFRQLLEIYNERVNAVESDKSLLITIPPNLLK